MNTEEQKDMKTEEVTLKKALIQGTHGKVPGDKIFVTPEQKKRLAADGFI